MPRVLRVAAKAIRFLLLLFVTGSSTFANADKFAGAAHLIQVEGEVKISRQGGKWTTAMPGKVHILQAGDAVRTGADGWAAMLTRDEGRIHIHRYTLFVLNEVAPTAGWLQTKVAHVKRSIYELFGWWAGETGQAYFVNNNPDIDASVRTDALELGVQGTAFLLKVTTKELSVLEVFEGSVLATNTQDPTDSVRAPAGTKVVARLGERLETSSLLIDPKDAVQWTLFVPPLLEARELAGLDEANAPLGRSVRTAYAAMQRGEIVEARTALVLSAQSFPSYATPWRLLALANLILGNSAEALRAAKASADAAPDSSASWIMLSNAYQAVHDLSGAMRATQRALNIDPGNVLALTNMARLQFGSDKDTDAAWITLQKAQLALERQGSALEREQRSTRAAEIENLRGYLLLARRDTVSSIQAFEQAARLNGRLGEPYLGLGIALMRQGHVARAFQAMATAVLLEPHRSLFHSYWGKMLHQIGRLDKALDMLALAKQYDAKDPTPYLYEALVLRDLNRPGQAIKALQSAIELNDFRGVFRSRFLLDQDLAVKNVDLSVLFNELGLGTWAQNKATAAVAQDYTNFAAHDMLQGSLSRQGRAWSQQSEALLARILAPANVNSFNTFNQYTPLFEQPNLDGTLSVGGGDRNTGGEIFAEGAVPSHNLAFGAFAGFSDDDGWRDTNGERVEDLATVVKWDPSYMDSFLLTASHNRFKRDDEFFPRYEYDFPADPEDRYEANLTRLELGYRHSFRPRTHLLLFVSRLDLEVEQLEHDTLEIQPPPDPISLGSLRFSEFERPYIQAQAQLMFGWDTADWGKHQIILGSVHYWLEETLDSLNEISVSSGDTSIPAIAIPLENAVEPRFRSHYLHDIWTLSPSWSLEAAVYFDHLRDGNVRRGTEWTVEKLNPRIGLVWKPFHADTLRVAAFRYLLPTVSARLDPTFIAGVPMLRDDREGTLESGINLVWEHEWEDGFFSSDLFVRERELDIDIGSGTDPAELETVRDRRHGVELKWNQLIWQSVGLAFRYQYLDTTDKLTPDTDRSEHLVSAALRYIAPSGIFGGIGQSYRHLRSVDENRPREDIFVTDLDLGYRFPGRRGELALKVGNLFDQKFNWVTDRFDVFQGRTPRREILATLSINF